MPSIYEARGRQPRRLPRRRSLPRRTGSQPANPPSRPWSHIQPPGSSMTTNQRLSQPVPRGRPQAPQGSAEPTQPQTPATQTPFTQAIEQARSRRRETLSPSPVGVQMASSGPLSFENIPALNLPTGAGSVSAPAPRSPYQDNPLPAGSVAPPRMGEGSSQFPTPASTISGVPTLGATTPQQPAAPQQVNPNGYTYGFGNQQQTSRLDELLERRGMSRADAGVSGPQPGLQSEPSGIRTVANNTQPQGAFNAERGLQDYSAPSGPDYPGLGQQQIGGPSGRTRGFAQDDGGVTLIGGQSPAVTTNDPVERMAYREAARKNARQGLGNDLPTTMRQMVNRKRMENTLASRRLGMESQVPTDPVQPGASQQDIQANLETQQQLRSFLGDERMVRQRPQIPGVTRPAEQPGNEQLTDAQRRRDLMTQLTRDFGAPLAAGEMSMEQVAGMADQILGGSAGGAETGDFASATAAQSYIQQVNPRILTEIEGRSLTDSLNWLREQEYEDPRLVAAVKKMKGETMTPRERGESEREITEQARRRELPDHVFRPRPGAFQFRP